MLVQSVDVPVIGIVTLPADTNEFSYPQYEYILENYIQWVSATGAKAIPISFEASQEDIKDLMYQINGLLLTGGVIDINIDNPIPYSNKTYNIYTKNVQYMLEIAKQINDLGQSFPIWGTCQGLQIMSYIAGGLSYDIIHHLENDNNIHRNGELSRYNRIFQNSPLPMINYISHKQPLYYYHELCVTQESFDKSKELEKFYKIIGFSYNSTDPKNKENYYYVAAIEAYNYPFFAVQFHPEATQFNQGLNTNKQSEAIEVSQYLANFFNKESRKNNHQFKDPQVLDKLLFRNYNDIYLHEDEDFGNYYFFKTQSINEKQK